MNEKLNPGTFENIEFGELKGFLKNNKDTEGLKSFVREYIQTTLSEEKNPEKKDFEFMEGYIENLKEYKEVLKDFRDDLSLKTIELLVFGQSFEEFKIFCQNKYVAGVLETSNEKNLQNMLKFCNSIDLFKKLCEKFSFRFLLEETEETNFEKLLGLCKTLNQFEEVLDEGTGVINKSNQKNLELVLNLCDTSTQLVNM
ncbi:hypothetical protein [Candidatus Absconditicoccus praedator]|uniref:hypothetical protein n=1 Tax=Candidatus Absconditicoccus praedator TaxID=2735562 RepID=UPI001E46F616|nr:hypothetical protein [Candidatus Absconditicoccus praedator]UFX83392.1 hypothetical protein HLG78_04660 [Candidatus Absconditicoccus praedator]